MTNSVEREPVSSTHSPAGPPAPAPSSVGLDPISFAETELGLSLYPWQDRAIAHLKLATGPRARRINIAVAAPNGSGKDERVIPSAAYWWVTLHRRGRVVITSKSDLQLTQQTIPQLERHKEKFEGYSSIDSPRYELTTKSGGKIIAFVTNKASRVEGWHKEDDINGPLLLIVNEAKSVDEGNEDIFTGLDRCTPNALMLVSSTGLKRGRFYDCFTKLRSDWVCVQAGLLDCPHIPQEKIDFINRTWGPLHPVTRSTLHGEFMDQDEVEKYVLSLGSLQHCLQNPPMHKAGVKAVFCDFADGGAENTIAYRDGNKIELVACWREANKLASVARFIQEFRKLGVSASQVTGDAADKEMVDLLKEAGWPIKRQNFGDKANDDSIYLSWGAEAWREAAVGIEKCEWILPKDDELIAQLTTRQRTFGRSGKLGVEEKYAMRKRNLPSPDRADAVVGVMATRDYAYLTKMPIDLSNWRNELDARQDTEVLEGIGAMAGL